MDASYGAPSHNISPVYVSPYPCAFAGQCYGLGTLIKIKFILQDHVTAASLMCSEAMKKELERLKSNVVWKGDVAEAIQKLTFDDLVHLTPGDQLNMMYISGRPCGFLIG